MGSYAVTFVEIGLRALALVMSGLTALFSADLAKNARSTKEIVWAFGLAFLAGVLLVVGLGFAL